MVVRAPELLHGKTSQVVHEGDGVLAGLPSPFTATRYHSLAVDPATVPAELEVTGHTPSGIVMALRHRELPIEGVQFHPESVLTEGGHRMLATWLDRLRPGARPGGRRGRRGRRRAGSRPPPPEPSTLSRSSRRRAGGPVPTISRTMSSSGAAALSVPAAGVGDLPPSRRMPSFSVGWLRMLVKPAFCRAEPGGGLRSDR